MRKGVDMPEMTLDKGSSNEAIRDWISSCISARRKENPDEAQDQSVAACIDMAREATGKQLQRGGKK